jgi:multidrug efflux system membrane fusion protein
MRFLKILVGLCVALALALLVGKFMFPQAWQDAVGSLAADASQQPEKPAGGEAAMAQAKPQAFPVPVTAVVTQTVPVYLDYVGTTEALRYVTMQAKVTGYLAQYLVKDGTDVKEGDLIYKIDDRDFQATLDEVKAQLQSDVAALEYAKVSQARNYTLSQTGAVAKDTNDEKTSLMHQAEASIAADKAKIRNAELTLSYTEIRAPFDGRIGKTLVHEGTLVKEQETNLNNLVQLAPIYATFNPSETDLAQIEKYRSTGDIAVDILLTGETEPRFHGKLTFVDNNVDRNTGTITARATIENPGNELLPGQYVRVRLHLTEQPDTLLVPQAALGSSQMGRFVYVIGKGGVVEQRFIKTGAVFGDLIVVSEGIAATDQVITGNLQKIGPGMPVTPMQAQPATGQQGS